MTCHVVAELNSQCNLFLFAEDVLSEDMIMKWYKDAHSSKGKSVFLEQMKKFIEWLQNAEEGLCSFQFSQAS